MNINFNDPNSNYVKGAGQDRVQNTNDKNVSQLRDSQSGAQQSSGADDVALSSDSRVVAKYTEMLNNREFEPRMELVNAARERVAEGFYNSQEFIDALASAIVKK
jgi:hypothetical protein